MVLFFFKLRILFSSIRCFVDTTDASCLLLSFFGNVELSYLSLDVDNMEVLLSVFIMDFIGLVDSLGSDSG